MTHYKVKNDVVKTPYKDRHTTVDKQINRYTTLKEDKPQNNPGRNHHPL